MISNSVSIDEFRSNLADFIGKVMYGKDRIMIKKYNRDAAVLLSVQDYERLLDPTKSLSKTQWKEAVQSLESIREKIPAVDPAVIQKEVNQAVKDIRNNA